MTSIDSLEGAAGTDTLVATIAGTSSYSPTLSNIEKLVTTFTGAGTLNLANATGVTSIEVTGSSVAANITNIASPSGLALNVNSSGQNVTFDFKDTSVSGTADSASLTVTDVTAGTIAVAGNETVTIDGYVVSGHRRLAAAKRLGLTAVPARMISVQFELMDSKARMDLLRLHNYQRSKSASERIREKMLEIDPSHAHSEMVKRRIKNRNRSDPSCVAVRLGRVKKRPKITTLQFLAKVKEIITENKPYWPLTDRRVHYLLLNAPPLKHDKKPDSKYQNDKNSYKALTHLLIRARLSDEIPMNAIEDSTRPIQLAGGFQSLEQFVGQEVSNFLNGYSRELTIGQPDHIEIMLEKNALRSVVEYVARDYCIPVTTGRGFSSLSPRYELQQRFLKSGKSRLVLLMLTDFDPDGEMIASSFARSLRDDLGLVNIVAVKVALNADDVFNYDLPSDMDAKPSSPNYESFVERFGTKAVELDAIPVQLLQQKLREAIEQYLDMDEFNAQLKLEQQDAVEIEAYRKVLMETITPIKKDDPEEPPLPTPSI